MNEPYSVPEDLRQSTDERTDEYVRMLKRLYPSKVFDPSGRELKDWSDGQPAPINPDGIAEAQL